MSVLYLAAWLSTRGFMKNIIISFSARVPHEYCEMKREELLTVVKLLLFPDQRLSQIEGKLTQCN